VFREASLPKFLQYARLAAVGWLLLLALCSAFAQTTAPESPAWLDQSLLAAAKAEGSVTVFSSTNEEEGLPLWKIFETATGIKVNYLRASDSQILSRILIETRAGNHSWDIANIGNVNKIPPELRAAFEPSEAKNLIAAARDPDHRWYGAYANYGSPAYNTKLVKKDDLPKTYADFLKHPEWAGKIAIDGTDGAWLYAIYQQYGADAGRKLVSDIVTQLKPVVVDGHLAVARGVGSGEYAVALNNYVMLTLNVELAGGPTDFWTMDPVTLFFGQVGVAAQSPHPNAARLAANFIMSRDAQAYETKFGRLPTRADVPTNPPDVLDRINRHKVVNVLFNTEEDRDWSRQFTEIFKAR
jgi:iron(III) transport system substrate-binding protein